MGTTPEIGAETKVIFFDGVCNLCNSSVNYVINHDKKKQFSFASLQSEFAKEILAKYDADHQKLESIVLVKGGKIYKKSNAALEIVRELNGILPAIYLFKIIPTFVRDWVYDLIARNRYSWFGKRDSCRLPTPELKERFLDSYNVS